ncbi:YjfB family protein [Bacillus litorisediminis]|uniref:YjfB family protein n=1 Tax=Bacillus litorisediminis TaxID=2922713 RepID=UPI001FB0128B|nr:YjfB family protein [Bacillus litorisediminis]
MDIPLLSMSLSQSNLQSQVDLSLMKKVMNTSETNANGLMKMLESSSVSAPSVHPFLGQKIDVQV